MQKLKKWKSLTYAANETKSEKLPSNNRLVGVLLDLTGNLVLTGGSSDPTLVQDAPATLFKQIKVTMGGKEVYRLTGIDAYWFAYLWNRFKPAITQPTISGAATYAMAVQLPIFFSGPGSLLPDLSILVTNQDLDPQIEVDWGTTTEIATGGDRAITLTSIVCNILAILETGDVKPRYFRSMVSNQLTVAAASTSAPLPLNYGDGFGYRAIFIRAVLNSVRSNSLINNVILKLGSGDDQVINLSGASIQRDLQSNQGLDPANYPAGIYMINFDRYKDWSKILPAEDVGQIDLEFDVASPTGTTFVKVVPELVRKIAGN